MSLLEQTGLLVNDEDNEMSLKLNGQSQSDQMLKQNSHLISNTDQKVFLTKFTKKKEGRDKIEVLMQE